MPIQKKVDDIQCLDKYEKEKLTSIFSIHKDDSLFVMDAENVFDNEIILRLKDKSSHSVTLLDKDNAKHLFFLIKEINNGKRRFIKAEYSNNNENTLKIISETIIL
jgi:hypothetical protein